MYSSFILGSSVLIAYDQLNLFFSQNSVIPYIQAFNVGFFI